MALLVVINFFIFENVNYRALVIGLALVYFGEFCQQMSCISGLKFAISTLKLFFDILLERFRLQEGIPVCIE